MLKTPMLLVVLQSTLLAVAALSIPPGRASARMMRPASTTATMMTTASSLEVEAAAAGLEHVAIA